MGRPLTLVIDKSPSLSYILLSVEEQSRHK